MNLLLPYEYTSHCTEPLSNRVGQDHHWISFCPWAITVPSVDRLSKMRWLHSSLPRYRDVHPTVSTLVLSQSESISVRTYLTSSLDDLITSWLQQTSYSFSFLGRIFDKRDSFSRADETDRTKTEKSVSFDSTSPPRLTDQRPTNTMRQPTADSKVPLFASSRGSSTRCLVWRFSVNISSSPKNLLLFWGRCVLPYDRNIRLKIDSG